MFYKFTDPNRILYVEDDINSHLLIPQMLRLLGYEVIYAANGKLGVEKAINRQPDIILMDVRMQAMDGPEAIRILRRHPNTAKTPIFVLSTYAETQDLYKKAGADRFLAKPIGINKITSTIQEMLGERTLERR